jgi:hypothetical protein
MMAMRVEIKGLDRLVASFAKIPRIAAKNMRIGLKEGLGIVEDYSSTHHKYRSHTGHADAAYKTEVAPNGMSGTLTLDPSISGAPYVIPLHEGHKAYTVVPVHKKALAWVDKGMAEILSGMKGIRGKRRMSMAFAKRVNIPAAPGDPFLYRAFGAKKREVLDCVRAAQLKTIKEAGF